MMIECETVKSVVTCFISMCRWSLTCGPSIKKIVNICYSDVTGSSHFVLHFCVWVLRLCHKNEWNKKCDRKMHLYFMSTWKSWTCFLKLNFNTLKIHICRLLLHWSLVQQTWSVIPCCIINLWNMQYVIRTESVLTKKQFHTLKTEHQTRNIDSIHIQQQRVSLNRDRGYISPTCTTICHLIDVSYLGHTMAT